MNEIDDWLIAVVDYIYYELCHYECETEYEYNPKNIAIYNFLKLTFPFIITCDEFYKVYDILTSEKEKYNTFIKEKSNLNKRGYYGPECFTYIYDYLEDLMNVVGNGDFMDLYYDDEYGCFDLYEKLIEGELC